MQKLVDYAQGFSPVLLHHPLFNEAIAAWQLGSAIANLYRRYSAHGAGAIPMPEDTDFSRFAPEEKALLEEVYNVYGQFATWKLRDFFSTRIDAAN